MIECNIIQDLLPLYADGCCSDETRRAVEAHLKDCAACREILAQMRGDLPAPEIPAAEKADAQAMKTGMKKIRRRWMASLLAVVVLVIAVRIGWNQFRGVGLHPTNLNEYRICTAFLNDLARDDYEGAYEYFDIDNLRSDWAIWNFDQELMDRLEENGLAMFLKSTAELKAAGLTDYRYLHAYRSDGAYLFYFTVTTGQKTDTLRISVNDRGIEFIDGGNGYLPAPDALTQMCLWTEYLWQDYSDCYLDYESFTYVYENQN